MTGLGWMAGGVPGLGDASGAQVGQALGAAGGLVSSVGGAALAQSQGPKGAYSRTGKPSAKSAGIQIATGAAAGLATGAAVGSLGGPIGAIIGGAIGTVVGSVPGVMAMVKAKEGGSTHVQRANRFAFALEMAKQRNLPAAAQAVQAADSEIRRYQGLAERAAVTTSAEVASAVAQAVPPNQALSVAGNALVEDVNAFASGADSINPNDVQNPALLGLQEIPAGVNATNAALGPAQAANSNLERALIGAGA